MGLPFQKELELIKVVTIFANQLIETISTQQFTAQEQTESHYLSQMHVKHTLVRATNGFCAIEQDFSKVRLTIIVEGIQKYDNQDALTHIDRPSSFALCNGPNSTPKLNSRLVN